MRKWIGLGVMGAVLLAWPQAASAQTTSCASVVDRFEATHRPAWIGAGAPAYVCAPGPLADGSLGGEWNATTRTVTITPPTGTASAPLAFYEVTVAHETGHAWASANGVDLHAYAKIRGFSTAFNDYAVGEDYAETFALALGWYHADAAPSPYNFHTEAGRPSHRQVVALRNAGLLPH